MKLNIALFLFAALFQLICVNGKQFEQQHKQSTEKKIALYFVNDQKILNIIDKQNKISFIQNKELVEIYNDRIESTITDPDLEPMPKLLNLLYENENFILVGTKNRLLNLSLDNLNSNQQQNEIKWPLNNLKLLPKTKQECALSKLPPFVCQNYIRASIPITNDSIIMCGTPFKQPHCIRLIWSENSSKYIHNDELQIPQFYTFNKNNFEDSQNTPIFQYLDSIYFVILGVTFTQEPTINKQIFINNSNNKDGLKFSKIVKTPRGALKNANFRSSFGFKDKVYFFYFETNLADETNGLTFKTSYSLISQVCANDNGRASFSEDANRFMTFKKTEIYCYLPDYKDGFHIKYTDIQAATKPIITEDDDVFYAIFTLRRLNSVDSALCKYRISSVENVMNGYFKSMEHSTDPQIVYKKPLESCDKYKELKDSTLNEYYKEMNKFYKFQMEQTINEPALFALNNLKFTSIAVDEANERNDMTDVVYIGVDDGRVLKLAMKKEQPVIVEEYKIFEFQPVTSLIVHKTNGKINLIAMSDEHIKSINPDLSCKTYITCMQCAASRDPYCFWSSKSKKCFSTFHTSFNKNEAEESKKCFNFSEPNMQDENTDLIYTIKTESSKLVDTPFKIEDNDEFNINRNKNSNTLLLAILLTALLTCLVSVGLTWLFIKKRYQMKNYVSRHLLQSSSLTSKRSNQSNRSSSSSSSSSYNNYSPKNYIPEDELDKKKCQNFYETSPTTTTTDAILLSPKQVQSATGLISVKTDSNRYEKSATDYPTTTTLSSSESNNYSPNSNLTCEKTKYKTVNDTLSTSDESFDQAPSQINSNRFSKRNFLSKKNRATSNSILKEANTSKDVLNITKNLLSPINQSKQSQQHIPNADDD